MVVLFGAIVAGCLDHAVTGPDRANGVNFAARLVVLGGNMQSGAVNSALPTPVKLRVTDINGSPVAGASVAFSLRSGGGTLSPLSATSAADGSVSTVWTLGTALGENKVVAILSGAFVVDSATLTATGTNGPAAKLAIDAGDNQHAPIGTVLPAAVSTLVTDNYGNPVPGAAVTYAVTGGGSRIDLVRTTSDANGKISANWTLSTTAGLQTATASLANGASISYRAVADAGLPVQIIQESGSGQTGTVGRALAAPVSVRVVDGYGNNVRGVSVSWTADDGTISANSATTDTLGRSQGRWVLGNRAGTQSASVSVTGLSPVNVVAIAQAAVPFQVTLETGDKQTQTVGQTLPLPLVAKIVDQFGNGIAGFPVTWNAASGGGSLLATLATSDNTGRSTAIWTLGSAAGSQLATLAVTGLPLTVYSATAVAAAGDSVVIEAGNNQAGRVGSALGTPLIIRVRDTSGNPVVGTSVVFAVASGGGSVAPSVAVTDANGRAQAIWTLGSFSGAQTATATVGAKSVTFTATGSASGGGGGGGGSPTQLVLVSGNGQTGNVSQSLTAPMIVRVIDASGVPVTGVNVTWTLPAGNSGGFASPSVSSTDGSGQASMLWTLGSKVGLQQITASATGVPSLTLQATVQVGSSGAVIMDNGNGQVSSAGALLATYLRVLVVDQSGTAVVGARVTWAVVTGLGSLAKSWGLTNAAGYDSVAWTLGATSGAQTVSATVTGVTPVTFTATASTGATPAQLVLVSGNAQSGGVGQLLASPVIVKVVDASGYSVPGIDVSWAIVSGGGTSSSVTSRTDGAGQAQTLWTLGNSLGTQRIRATATGLTALNLTATATVAATGAIVMQSGNNQAGAQGAPLGSKLYVLVVDQTGNPVNGATVNWAIATGTGSISKVTGTTNAFGLDSLTWTLGATAGTQTVTAGVTGVGSVTFTATAGGSLVVFSGNNQTGSVSSTLAQSLVVMTMGPTGLPIPGITVNWLVTAGGGMLSKAQGVTDVAGNDAVQFTLGAVGGTNTVTATVAGLGSVSFTATGLTSSGGVPWTIVKVNGDGQTGRSATALASPLIVEVRDVRGTPLAGVQVLFTQGASNLDGFVAPSPTTTNASGQVSVQWTLGSNVSNAVKTNTVTASLPLFGSVTPVSFTAAARPQFRMRFVRGTSGSAHCIAALGAACAAGLQIDTTGATVEPQYVGDLRTDTLVVQVYDPTDSTGVQGVSVNWAVQAGDGTDGRPVNSVLTTDNFGFAKNVWLLRDNNGRAIPPSNIAKRMIASVASIGEVEFRMRVFPGAICSVSRGSSATPPVVGTSISDTTTVRDCSGFAIPGVTITLSTALPGIVAPTSAITNSNGQVLTTWTMDTVPGVRSLSATATGQTSPYLVFGVDPIKSASASRVETVVAGAPAARPLPLEPLEVNGVPGSNGSLLPVSSFYTVIVVVRDRYGNRVPTQVVNFAASGGGVAGAPGVIPSSVSSPVGTTGTDGSVSVVWTLGNVAVPNTLTITAGGVAMSISRTGN
ncbi:MAG TPA: hypothetical protein VIK25_00115 [Gemmatimonadaceae bacterium]